MNTIAVVEDNPDNRLLINALLEDVYSVKEYENGIDALKDFEHNVPELILLDISLPEMDGTEVLRNLKASDKLKQIPVIALTAHAMAGDREHFLSKGFDEYIMKPIVDENELLSVIARLLQK